MDTIDLVKSIDALIQARICHYHANQTLFNLHNKPPSKEEVELILRDIRDGFRERSAQGGIVSDGSNKIHIS